MFGDGKTQIRCGEWGIETTGPHRKHAAIRPGLLYVMDPDRHIGWIVWDGHAYRWIAAY